MLSKAVVLALVPTLVSAHLRIGLASTWGGPRSDLENPLNSGSYDWFCHGGRKDTARGTTEMRAGGSVTVPVVCGEAMDDLGNARSHCQGDLNAFHGGGGCAIAISYKSNPTDYNDFTVISVNHACPSIDNLNVKFDLPKNLPNGDAVCSWTWVGSWHTMIDING